MAQKLTLVDDLDGTIIGEGEGGTIVYSIGGDTYSIDLSSENTDKLFEVLAPFVEKSRKVAPSAASARRQKKGTGVDTVAVRAWAREAGVPVSERGRIAASVIAAYEAAH